MSNNLILNVDSYKTSHFLQYPAKTTHISSYIEPRGGVFKQAVFFGLQMFIQAYLTKPITEADVDEAKLILAAHGMPFNEEGWRYIIEKHQGYLPIKIEAVPEGTVITVQNVMVQIVNTDPNCGWLTSYLETAILRAVWYPTTVATVSWHCRQVIKSHLAMTADSTDDIDFKLQDFGARGATSEEAAAIGGAAHLVNFQRTATLSGIVAARRHYDAQMPGFAIPAAEHSTITSWGRENETEAYENMLTQFSGPGKCVAVVSDSYDLWHAIDNIWGETLKTRVETTGGTLIIRPDSGEPVAIVTETIDRLMNKFGYRVNSKGYKVLPDYIRVIQGDGISLQTIGAILTAMQSRGQSAENITFGMGGELLQKVNRDTMKFAMKASAAKVDGEWRDIYKDPCTDQGKRSKKGRQAVVRQADGSLATIPLQELRSRENLLTPVFENGQLLKKYDFSEIRQRANGTN